MSLKLEQVVRYRLLVQQLAVRLPAGEYVEAARYALQDSIPRSALLSLHARVRACEPAAWADPRLIQTYSPRRAVHVLPRADAGVFTIGRLPDDAEARAAVEAAAELVCGSLGGRERRAGELTPQAHRNVRFAAASGRIALRWTTSALFVREIPRPEIDRDVARLELCRRHLHAFGPTTPAGFAWWAGICKADAGRTWQMLATELQEIDVSGNAGWVLAVDEPTLWNAPPARGVRFLPSEDLKLFGGDHTGLFPLPAGLPFDTFHPHGLMIDGALVGVWGRRGGKVSITTARKLSAPRLREVEAEALSFPIPGATMSVDIAS